MDAIAEPPLSSTELAALGSYESVIQQGLESFVEVGNALAKIRDGRLYREKFGTFEEYCQAKWSLTRNYVNRLVAAAEVAVDVVPIGTIPKNEAQARPLAAVPKEERAAVWQEAVDTAPKDAAGEPKITAKHVEQVVAKAMDKPAAVPHVANNSGNNEWYTPPEIVDAARKVLGGIDCDPASCEKANETVRARKYYSASDCGLSAIKWGARVWMNPPYAQPLCAQFCESLVERFNRGDVRAAIVLVNNATETAWFDKLASAASAVCFLRGRVKFLDANGEPKGTPLQGQCVLYFGDEPRGFLQQFASLGWGATIA